MSDSWPCPIYNGVEYGAGACYHALGYARKAVADYQAVFMTPDSGLDTEARGLVCLGFYQKVCPFLTAVPWSKGADLWGSGQAC